MARCCTTQSDEGDFEAMAFRDTCRDHLNPSRCYTFRALYAKMVLHTATGLMRQVECDTCWNYVLQTTAKCGTKSANVRARECADARATSTKAGPTKRGPSGGPEAPHLCALVPMCASCCAALYGYRAVDELVLCGRANDIVMVRFAFFGAFHACDAIRALRLFLRFAQLAAAQLAAEGGCSRSERFPKEIPFNPSAIAPKQCEKVSLETTILTLMRDAVHSLCLSECPAPDIADFLRQCYFPHDGAKTLPPECRESIDFAKIWDSIDFMGYYAGTGREDVIDYLEMVQSQ
jgi:hypothetical protein